MGAFGFRAGKSIVKWGLDGGCVWKETPVEIWHSQEMSELTDGLGRRTGLEIGDTFREGLGTHGCNFVPQE